MAKEAPESELKRLQAEQVKRRRDEVFGGLLPKERAEYDRKTERIDQLVRELAASTGVRSAKAEQEKQWNKEPETDISKTRARQPYRSREQGYPGSSAASRRKLAKGKNESDEKGSE